MQELVVNVMLPMALISVSVGYVFYSFKRDRSRLRDHRRTMDYLLGMLPMVLQRLQEESREKVNWKEEGF